MRDGSYPVWQRSWGWVVFGWSWRMSRASSLRADKEGVRQAWRSARWRGGYPFGRPADGVIEELSTARKVDWQ
jgi:hypothetical protein